ncbi:hypothetical protein [Photobacterium sp. R1]
MYSFEEDSDFQVYLVPSQNEGWAAPLEVKMNTQYQQRNTSQEGILLPEQINNIKRNKNEKTMLVPDESDDVRMYRDYTISPSNLRK